MSKQTIVKNVTATAPVGGKTADLKNQFAAGSIPLDTDFSELIDIAECGRRAVGQSADQSDNSVGSGLALATDGASVGKLSVLPKANAGITVDASGVGVKAGKGVTVDTNGVSVNQSVIFPKGMIMMFSGTTIPPGWALCDGNNGTPNLIDRFILAGSSAGEHTSAVVNGNSGSKSFAMTTASSNITISVDAHQLTVAEIPAHTHEIYDQEGNLMKKDSMHCNERGQIGIPAIFDKGDNSTSPVTFQSTGGNQGHSHNITQKSHSHNTSIIVPYFVLMFIMKV